MSKSRNDRQILAFGAKGQLRIEEQFVGIVGLGGLGAHVAQGLAYLGVRRYLLIDDDMISLTNLNRTPGAFLADIGLSKVEVARRHILQINPDAEVRIIHKNLRAQEALEALSHATTIFGCVDHDGPRLIMMELAAAYRIDFIDSASEIFPPKDNAPFDFGGRVVVAKAGEFCLDCAGQIDMESAKQDLEDSETLKIREAHGYGLARQGEAPSVFSLNGVIANLAMTEFMVSVTGIREPQKMLSFRGMRGIVIASVDKRKSECFTCGYIAGKREKANIFRYALS